jgi:hypothetical protein
LTLTARSCRDTVAAVLPGPNVILAWDEWLSPTRQTEGMLSEVEVAADMMQPTSRDEHARVQEAGTTRDTRVGLWPLLLVLGAALVGLALVAAWPVVPPRSAPASVSESAFSAERAMQDLEVIAAVPHPIGSAAQQRVRDYLVAQAEGARPANGGAARRRERRGERDRARARHGELRS